MTTTASALSANDIQTLLQSAGLRTTAPRRTALALLSRGGHWTAAEVYEAVKSELPGTSLQATYGVLTALVDARILRKVDPPGDAAHYEILRGDNHHHLVCNRCGEIRDVPCAIGSAPCLAIDETHGYDIFTADVTFRGLCPSCRGAESQEMPSASRA